MCLSDLLSSEQKQPSSIASRTKVIFATGASIWATAWALWLIRAFVPDG